MPFILSQFMIVMLLKRTLYLQYTMCVNGPNNFCHINGVFTIKQRKVTTMPQQDISIIKVCVHRTISALSARVLSKYRAPF